MLQGVERLDIAIDADSFARLALSFRHVFITENETNFQHPPMFRSRSYSLGQATVGKL